MLVGLVVVGRACARLVRSVVGWFVLFGRVGCVGVGWWKNERTDEEEDEEGEIGHKRRVESVGWFGFGCDVDDAVCSKI